MMIPAMGISASAKIVSESEQDVITINELDAKIKWGTASKDGVTVAQTTANDSIAYLGDYNLSAIDDVEIVASMVGETNTAGEVTSYPEMKLAWMSASDDTIDADYLNTNSGTIRSANQLVIGYQGLTTDADTYDTFTLSGTSVTAASKDSTVGTITTKSKVLGQTEEKVHLFLYGTAQKRRIRVDTVTINYTSVTEVFEDTYTISISDETGEAKTAKDVAYNSKVELTAEKATADGAAFLYWVKNGCLVSKNLTYTYYVNEDADIVAVYEGMEEATTVRNNAVNDTHVGKPVVYVSYDDSEAGQIVYYVEITPGRTAEYEKVTYSELRTWFQYSTDGFGTKTEWQWDGKIPTGAGSLDMRNCGQYKVTFEGYADAEDTPIDVKSSCFERGTQNKIGYTYQVGPASGNKRASVYHNSGNSNDSCGDVVQ